MAFPALPLINIGTQVGSSLLSNIASRPSARDRALARGLPDEELEKRRASMAFQNAQQAQKQAQMATASAVSQGVNPALAARNAQGATQESLGQQQTAMNNQFNAQQAQMQEAARERVDRGQGAQAFGFSSLLNTLGTSLGTMGMGGASAAPAGGQAPALPGGVSVVRNDPGGPVSGAASPLTQMLSPGATAPQGATPQPMTPGGDRAQVEMALAEAEQSGNISLAMFLRQQLAQMP